MPVEPSNSLQWILVCWMARYAKTSSHRKRVAIVQAMTDIGRCGTGALGWRIFTCPEHGDERRPNQCRRRDCPQCVGRRSFLWACAVEGRLLDCAHFHVVFTLSDVLNPYWRHNRCAMAQLFFEATASALKRLLADPKHMGGMPAMLGVLHTHGGQLVLHPHIHFIVSSVGLDKRLQLVRARRDTLLPYRCLRRAFQHEFLRRLAALARRSDFILPKGTTQTRFQALLTELFAQPERAWNARIFRREEVFPVVRYLSRTVYGGAIRNDRIVALTPEDAAPEFVTFRFQDHRSREEDDVAAPFAECTLPLETFVDRWTDHIHEPGFKAVRHFGLFAPGCRPLLEIARAHLHQPALPKERTTDPDAPDPDTIRTCRHCNRIMACQPAPPTPLSLSAKAVAVLRTRDPPFQRTEARA